MTNTIYNSIMLCQSRGKNYKIFSTIYFLLLFLVFFNSSSILLLKKVGDYSMYGIVIMSMFYVGMNYRKTNLSSKPLLFFLLFCAYQVISAIFHLSLNAVTVVVQSLVLLALMIYVSNGNKNVIIRRINVLLFVCVLLAFVDFLIKRWTGILLLYTSPNRIGMIGFFSILFDCLAIRKHNLFYSIKLILAVILILISDARTPLLCFAVMALAYLFLRKRIEKGKVKYAFIVLAILMFGAVWGYIYLSKTSLGIDINNYIYELTGKDLFSGRHRIWSNFFKNANSLNLIFGYGAGARLEMIVASESISTHNQYIEIILQYGFVGLFIFFFVLNSIWKSIIVSDNASKCLYAVFFLGIVIYNIFEVVMIQNVFCIAILSWIMFTLPQNKKRNLVRLT